MRRGVGRGFTRVTVPQPGPIRVGVDFSPLRALSGGQRCAQPARRRVSGAAGSEPSWRAVRDRRLGCATASCSRGPLDLLVQLLVLAGAYTAWRWARGAVAPDDLGAAFAHGRDLVSLERSMHTFVEIDVQNWAVDTGWAGEVARWGYANLHFKGSCLALLVTYFVYRGSFGFLRNTVFAAMALSVLCYWLYPTAPPRFLEELGLDGGTAVTGNNTLLSDPDNPFFNPVAAVPSMHVGLASSSRYAGPARQAPLAQGAALRLPPAS